MIAMLELLTELITGTDIGEPVGPQTLRIMGADPIHPFLMGEAAEACLAVKKFAPRR